MTESFRSQDEEIRSLLRQLKDVRGDLQSLSKQLSSIERHVARAFPRHYKQEREVQRKAQEREAVGIQPLSENDALAAFDDLARLWHDGETEKAREKMSALPLPHLRSVAFAVGLNADKRVGRAKLASLVTGRLSESAMLRSNLTVEDRK